MPKPAPGQSPLYKGTADCFMRTINKEVNINLHIIDLAGFDSLHLSQKL